MKIVLTALTFLLFEPCWSQHPDEYVKQIEKLRSKGKLTEKTYPGKTFVGSLTGYYENDSLVLINTLTDAEAAGGEILYYIRNGALKKIFIMSAQFESNKAWAGYYAKHRAAEECLKCHQTPTCLVTEITLGRDTTLSMTSNRTVQQVTQKAKTEMIEHLSKTAEELKVLLRELE